MNIAVFADVHGRILLCFMLCARWQRETGEHLDLILQAGDLGAYPDRTRLDKTTIRHAERDPSELGFLDDFATSRADVATILAETDCPLIFVRGNHEDHAWLDGLEAQAAGALFPVDAYRRIFCLKTAVPYTHHTGDEAITILWVGRIGPPTGERDPQKSKYIQDYEMERVYNLSWPQQSLDVLLTHNSARDFVTPGYGMDEIRLVLDAVKPIYHFYGHTERPLDLRRDANGVTVSCKMSDLHWDQAERGQPLMTGAMGILRWRNRGDHHLEVVDAPWLHAYTAYTWRHVS